MLWRLLARAFARPPAHEHSTPGRRHSRHSASELAEDVRLPAPVHGARRHEPEPPSPSAHEVLAARELGSYHYLAALRHLHSRFAPATYLEIGSYRGRSITLVGPHTDSIGVDPAPKIDYPVTPRTKMVSTTSDAFFAAWDEDPPFGGRPVNLGFIDGMHLSEFALRDFANLERRCRPDSLVLLHDCYPLDEATAARERKTVFWSGDIWRTVLALRKYRPDLDVTTLAVPPTGLGIVGHLDPGSSVLHTRYEEIVANMHSWSFSDFEPRKREALNAIEGTEASLDGLLDRLREVSSSPGR